MPVKSVCTRHPWWLATRSSSGRLTCLEVPLGPCATLRATFEGLTRTVASENGFSTRYPVATSTATIPGSTSPGDTPGIPASGDRSVSTWSWGSCISRPRCPPTTITVATGTATICFLTASWRSISRAASDSGISKRFTTTFGTGIFLARRCWSTWRLRGDQALQRSSRNPASRVGCMSSTVRPVSRSGRLRNVRCPRLMCLESCLP